MKSDQLHIRILSQPFGQRGLRKDGGACFAAQLDPTLTSWGISRRR
jgi:hypothetical protein